MVISSPAYFFNYMQLNFTKYDVQSPLDIMGDTHVQKISISSIPSDVLLFSNITSISVDDETSVSFQIVPSDIYFLDKYLQKILKDQL